LNIGREHVGAQAAGVVDVLDHDVALVRISISLVSRAAMKLGGLVRLEIRRLIAELGISGGVGLLKPYRRNGR